MPPVFEVAFDVRAGLGEGALWDWRRGALVSVDILAGRLLVGDPADGSTREIAVGQPVGAALLQHEDELLLAVRDGFASVDLRDGALTDGPRVEADEPGMRMNDAACDAAGRCFAGTMEFDGSGRPGTLYRLDPDLSVRPVLGGFGVSNGIGWSLVRRVDVPHRLAPPSRRRLRLRRERRHALERAPARPTRTPTGASPTGSPSTPRAASGSASGTAPRCAASRPTGR